MMNPTLADLIGGIQPVTLSDDEAKRRGTQKTVLERKAPPTFDVLIEIIEMDKLAIHHDVANVVDKMLRGVPPRPEIRVRNVKGEVEVVQTTDMPFHPATEAKFEQRPDIADTHPIPAIVKVFPYGVSRNRLERAIRELHVPGYISKELGEANAVIALKAHERKNVTILQDARRRGLPLYVIKSNTYAQIAGVIRDIFRLGESDQEVTAIKDAEQAISRVLETGEPQELTPQTSYVRRLQHQLAEKYELTSESIGTEPYRRVRIFKP
jgi:hypothetical protein